jgi:hypothetical protein
MSKEDKHRALFLKTVGQAVEMAELFGKMNLALWGLHHTSGEAFAPFVIPGWSNPSEVATTLEAIADEAVRVGADPMSKAVRDVRSRVNSLRSDLEAIRGQH